VHQGAKIALASGIVLSGLAGAALFRRSPSPTTPNGSPETPLDRPIVPPAVEDSPAAARLLGRIDPARVDPARAADTAAASASGRTTLAAPSGPLARRPSAAAEPSPPRKQAVSPDAQADEQEPAGPAPRAGQVHQVRDGDTLSSLARHYLGSSKRFLEIYEANRDLLSNPDLLPIGARLKIPPADAVVRTAAPATRANPPLAPISPRPAPVRPSAGSPRTYRVKAGDTLVAIAQRFYGDGERYGEIYDANRERLKAPADLREGLLLEIP
jgi:nucleoid-associated protein YgaU